MSNAEKALYFLSKIKPSNTLYRHMELKDDTLTYDISARIVETIIGELSFGDDEVLADYNGDDYSDDDVANKIAKKIKEKTNAL